MELIGSEKGIHFNYTNEIQMIDNYLPTYKMEDEINNKDSRTIEENLNQIVKDITARKSRITRKGIKSDILSKYGRRIADKISYNYGYKQFIINDSCTGCRVCEKVCPVKNISVSKKPEFSHKCEMCFACIHHCPENAIHLKSEKSKGRYINRNVKLKEIIDANNQSKVRI